MLVRTSPNHPIRPRQHVRRNGEPDLFGSLQIEDKFKLQRLLHRQIGRLGDLEDSCLRRSQRTQAIKFGADGSSCPLSAVE